MVSRLYVEKKPGLSPEADSLRSELREILGIRSLERVRVLNRYDVEGLDPETLDRAARTVFSEPPVDFVYREAPEADGAAVFAVEYLPGQFDQRADSASQCIGIMTAGDRPTVRSAKVYMLYGGLTAGDLEKVKKYVINPVDSREAALSVPATLAA